eukprot:5799826-Alexandrium_andersonii.AAC.1
MSGWAGGGERGARSAAAAPGLTLPREGERAAGEGSRPGLGAAGGLASPAARGSAGGGGGG